MHSGPYIRHEEIELESAPVGVGGRIAEMSEGTHPEASPAVEDRTDVEPRADAAPSRAISPIVDGEGIVDGGIWFEEIGGNYKKERLDG